MSLYVDSEDITCANPRCDQLRDTKLKREQDKLSKIKKKVNTTVNKSKYCKPSFPGSTTKQRFFAQEK